MMEQINIEKVDFREEELFFGLNEQN